MVVCGEREREREYEYVEEEAEIVLAAVGDSAVFLHFWMCRDYIAPQLLMVSDNIKIVFFGQKSNA